MRVSNFPPPDSYNPAYQTIKERNASWSFGTGPRSKLGACSLNVPAPGTYVVPNRAVEGPNFTLGQKLDNQSSIG